jgi:chemotaxis protein methyltransferase CheR
MHLSERQDIEVKLFLEALNLRHGYDFRQYAPASLKRRVLALTAALNARSISEITEKLIHDEALLPKVIEKLSVPVSEMFREPRTFALLREMVLPQLASFPHVNIWQAGCAHGEEVYSLAILLAEAAITTRAQIYATDISDAALTRAQEGIYPSREMPLYRENYKVAGGTRQLDDYCTERYNYVKMHDELRGRITFANHNLVSDGVFGEMHLILCRNVLIYFNDALQDRVLHLFRDSLARGGYLCIGSKETLAYSGVKDQFRALRKGIPLFKLLAAA